MAFPSTFSGFTLPNPTQKLNSPSQSSIVANLSSTIGQLEAVVGLAGDSSVLGTLIGDLRSPDSGGGGHVQTANKGGTGQTAYTKGDVLIATSASVLTKLTVGTDAQILKADSSVATGVKWAEDSTPKVFASASVISITNSSAESSLLSTTIPASTLGSNNAVKAILYVGALNTNTVNDAVTLRVNFGSTSVLSMVVGSISSISTPNVLGEMNLDIIGNNSIDGQRGILRLKAFRQSASTITGVTRYGSFVSSVHSGGAQPFGVTAQWNNVSGDNRITIDGSIVEKIT
jgi:hypothetical protein